MNKNKKLVVSIAVVLLLIVIISKFSSYTSTQTIDIRKITIQEKLFEKQFKEASYFANGKIIIEGKSDSSNSSNIKTEIIFKYSDNIDVSMGKFVPFYKNVEYTDNVTYKWVAKSSNGNEQTKFGQISLSGIYIIKGFISSTSTEKMIKKAVQSSIEKEIEKEAKKALNLKTSSFSTSIKIHTNL